MFGKTSIAAALLGLALTAAPAFANEIAVRYKDLDLSSAQGQKTLDRRINAAARQVCAYDQITTGTRLRSSASVTCYKQARAQVQKQVTMAIQSATNAQLGG